MAIRYDQECRQTEEYIQKIDAATDSMVLRNIAAEIITQLDTLSGEPTSYLSHNLTYALFCKMGELTGITLRQEEYGNPTPFALTTMMLTAIEGMPSLVADGTIIGKNRASDPDWHVRLGRARAARMAQDK